MSSYTVEAGAVKFGDAAGSYASLHVGRTRDLALVLQLRTFASEGLLMLLPVCLNLCFVAINYFIIWNCVQYYFYNRSIISQSFNKKN